MSYIFCFFIDVFIYLFITIFLSSVTSVSTVGQKSLYSGPGETGKQDLTFPEFTAMTQCVSEKAAARLKNPAQTVTVANAKLPFNLTIVVEVNYQSVFLFVGLIS